MQVSTGRTFPSYEAAISQGVPPADLVEVTGPPDAVASVARAVRDQRAVGRRRVANKVARRSRRMNRRTR